MTTGVFKRHAEIYVQTACKFSAYFTFGSKMWEKYFDEAGITIMDYLALPALEQGIYDSKVQDELVAALMIKRCKYNNLREWFKNQQLAQGTECAYPQTSSRAV